jgi:hypothetical protein
MPRLDGFIPERDSDRDHYALQPYSGDGTEVIEDLDFIAEAIRTDVEFEPFVDVGDVQGLYHAAVNLYKYVEAYEDRTGSLKLPD